MKISKRAWPVSSVCGIKKKIDSQPDYQRPAVWSSQQKQLLIDSMLRGYDLPKFYWRKVSGDGGQASYQVVDGQQRIRAIWEFQSGGYALARNADDIDGEKIAALYYEDLPDDLRIAFDTYNLDVILLEDADEDEVREMFLRLQNGTTLKAQEKRNAMSGAMRNFVHDLAGHQFFGHCGFANSRFTFDLIAAQMTLIELRGGPTNVKNADLNKMYMQADFDVAGPKAKKVRRVLDYLSVAFPTKTPELERYSVVSLYAMASDLLDRYVMKDRQGDIADWFLQFELKRRGQTDLPIDERDPDLLVYHEKTSSSTDAEESISWRHNYLLREFLSCHQDILQKDNQRLFTSAQRMAIYRRDKETCQVKIKCIGIRCDWENWEADHKVPWTSGGPTTVENGQVACLACNASKGASEITNGNSAT